MINNKMIEETVDSSTNNFDLNTEENKDQQKVKSFKKIQRCKSKIEKLNKQQKKILKKFKELEKDSFLLYNLKPLSTSQTIYFTLDTFITEDGTLRLNSILNQISIGFQKQKVQYLEENHNLGVVCLQFNKYQSLKCSQVQEVQQLIQKNYGNDSQKVYMLLLKLQRFFEQFVQGLQQINEEIEIEKEIELQDFIAVSKNYLQKYNLNNPNQMYFYQLGRINLAMKDHEIIQNGYSNYYLDFLGLDISSLKQIVFRQQKVDFMQNSDDITQQSILGLELLEFDCETKHQHYESTILTFDGFPIKLKQNVHKMCDIYQPKNNYGSQFGYMILLIEMDVNILDLQKLIEYRQRLAYAPETLNKDEFVRKELSYFFEDVEYSIHAQEFIEKFYQNNLKNLEDIKELYTDTSKQCKFRFLS